MAGFDNEDIFGTRLRVGNGAVGTPSMTFTSDTTTGMYLVSSNILGFAAGGAAAGQTNGSQWFFRDGSSGIPGITFISDANTGFRRSASDTFHAVTNAVDRMTWDAQGRSRVLQGFTIAVTKTAADYVVLNTDYYVGVTSTAAARAITLTSANFVAGQKFYVKDESFAASTNNITVTPTSGTIDNAASAVININGGCMEILFDGTNYFIL